jgi:glycosyltransferase involved in cell wall biosynthesis
MPPRFKVLLSAYACEPGKGSEPEVGWRWALGLSEFHDITVITRANNQPAIEAALAAEAGPHPQFIYYDLPGWLVRWKRHGLPVPIYYLLWQAAVRWRLRRRMVEFDLIHHLTFNSFRQPGFWWFCPKPVLLGPLGGGQICPWLFLMRFGRGLPQELLRSLTVLAAPLYPHLLLSFFCARLILAANGDTAARIPKWWRSKVRHLLETGINLKRGDSTESHAPGPGTRLIWTGRLEKIKGLDLMLHAFAQARQQNGALTLTVVGGGSEAEDMKQLAGRLNLGPAVRWLGQLPKDQVEETLAGHDIFLFTSLRDTSGNVLLEAMAAGLPSITLRHQGAAEIASEATALRIVPTTFAATATALARAIQRLSGDTALRSRMKVAARQRVLEVYAWSQKAMMMDRFYRELVAPDDAIAEVTALNPKLPD